MFNPHRFFRYSYLPVYSISAASIIGTMTIEVANPQWLAALLGNRWALQYFLLTPFMHSGFSHLLLNLMTLYFIGGVMLLPVIGGRKFFMLFSIAVLVGHLANNFFADNPRLALAAASWACSLVRCTPLDECR